jgi:hypothetical protein
MSLRITVAAVRAFVLSADGNPPGLQSRMPDRNGSRRTTVPGAIRTAHGVNPTAT